MSKTEVTRPKRRESPAGSSDQPAWHVRSGEAAVEELEAAFDGLSSEEAELRLAQYGPNRLPPPPRRGAWRRLLEQFNNVLIYVLVGAGCVTLLLQHWIDSAVIFGVVVINAIIGFLQEGKAERALEAIRGMMPPQANVLRDGRRVVVPAEELVPGDVVLLQSGDKVPADLRLLAARNLQTQEAPLTGESLPVEKSVAPLDAATPLGDRACMAYSGTLVTYGQGRGLVVATGASTEIGRISGLLARVPTLTTPLLRQMARFARRLTAAILAISVVTFGFGVWIRDYGAGEMFLAAVGLAVAAIPEGLPAIMTITLAIGVQRMARRNAVIRRLPAVETLGSVTVICSDKTGTLTLNQMTVRGLVAGRRSYQVTGAGYEPIGAVLDEGREIDPAERPELIALARAGALCNDACVHRDGDGETWTVDGDPMEGALLSLAMKAGLDPAFEARARPRVDVIPFESEHRFMATLHHDHEGHAFVFVKGAPERILAMCSREDGPGGPVEVDRAFWESRIEALAAEGQRVLALAWRSLPQGRQALTFGDVEEGLVLAGLFGLADPPRTDAIAAVVRCHRAGIRVKMITGDHARTARAIAAQTGLRNTQDVLTGVELDRLSDEALCARVREVDIFARASPENKLRLVQALQAEGQVVAMTGDGVNDAPALKRADIGVAMGRAGTEAAKEAAEMVLADDNFASIAHAVEEGRTVYDNLQKAILFILPTNGGEAATVVAAVLLGYALPLTPVQILWVNMITAVTLALALAFEPAERDIMARPPRRPNAPLLSGFLIWRVLFVSLLMLGGTFGVFLWERAGGADLAEARTMAVNALVMLEVFYLLNARFRVDSCLSREGLLGSRPVLVAIGLVLALQLLFTYTAPFQLLFESRPLDLMAWLRIALIGVALLAVVELEKAGLRRRIRRMGPAEPG
ncbi:MAG TPA: cation-transporting P-type ATPase [Kiloniellales bacterium]|nr:cation-transporting P-type ATPase [Kiloniellales bacterium]